VTFSTLARIGAVLIASASVLVLLDASSATSKVTPASYPSCGTYWNRNTPVTAKQRRVNACIVSASRDGRYARAAAALTTIEGDRIPTYFFVRGRGDVLVVTDSRRDRFGSAGWLRLRCRAIGVAGGMLAPSGCITLGSGKPSWLKPIRLPS
jgi:hypothetical protein